MRRFKSDICLRPDSMLFLLFVLGFIIGMVISFMHQNGISEVQYQWLDTTLMYLRYSEISYGEILFYVLKKRIGLILLIILICFTGKGKYILPAGGVIIGGFCGFFITEFIQYKGILGSALFMVSILPHYICYIYGYYTLIVFLNHQRMKMNNINQVGQFTSRSGTVNGRNFIKKYAPIAVVIMGILLECYVNPFFLKIFIKIFM